MCVWRDGQEDLEETSRSFSRRGKERRPTARAIKEGKLNRLEAKRERLEWTRGREVETIKKCFHKWQTFFSLLKVTLKC